MTKYTIKPITLVGDETATKGDLREWSLCEYYGIWRRSHDSAPYHKDSDINAGDKHISVKTAGFSLMAGTLCEGKTDFDGIWSVYEKNVHSNCFAYVTKDFTVYEMNLAEFKAFVYLFCRVTRESTKKGGRSKIIARSESKGLLNWLATQAVA